MAKHGELGRAAYYLVLIGGILLVVFSLLALVGYAISITVPFGGISFGFAFLPLILGIVWQSSLPNVSLNSCGRLF